MCTPGTIDRGSGEFHKQGDRGINIANETLAAGLLDMIAYPGPWVRYILSLNALKNVSNLFSPTKHNFFFNVLVRVSSRHDKYRDEYICEASGTNEQMSSVISAQSSQCPVFETQIKKVCFLNWPQNWTLLSFLIGLY